MSPAHHRLVALRANGEARTDLLIALRLRLILIGCLRSLTVLSRGLLCRVTWLLAERALLLPEGALLLAVYLPGWRSHLSSP